MNEQVLLIDDDAVSNFIHRRLMETKFKDCPINVFENGPDALNHIKSHCDNYYRIFLDINMPEMNGWQFLEALGKQDLDFRGSIIILTSSVEEDDRRKAANFDLVQGFISKPLTRHHLEEIEPLA